MQRSKEASLWNLTECFRAVQWVWGGRDEKALKSHPRAVTENDVNSCIRDVNSCIRNFRIYRRVAGSS